MCGAPGVGGSARASTYLYTTEDDIAGFAKHLKATIAMFSSIDTLQSSIGFD
jgi:selenocysteine lyase/cysteine desulfurase